MRGSKKRRFSSHGDGPDSSAIRAAEPSENAPSASFNLQLFISISGDDILSFFNLKYGFAHGCAAPKEFFGVTPAGTTFLKSSRAASNDDPDGAASCDGVTRPCGGRAILAGNSPIEISLQVDSTFWTLRTPFCGGLAVFSVD